MGIKWESVQVLNSPLTNQIYLGKSTIVKKGGYSIATDKSNDRTEEIKSAIMAHMDRLLKNDETEVSFDCPAGTLIWKRR